MSGFDKFKRVNPMSDKIECLAFHHMEYYAGDATSTYKRFLGALGAELAAKSDLSTGNDSHASYLVETGTCRMVFTAPYSSVDQEKAQKLPFPFFSSSQASALFAKHGLHVHAVGITVKDVQATFDIMVANGGIVVQEPTRVVDANPERGFADIAEIKLYGDVSLRLIDATNFKGSFLPNFEDVKVADEKYALGKYGIERIDHIVGNVHDLQATLKYIKNMTGFHDFAEFTSEDVGTVDSGLNSAVLANNNEMILFPVNEPTFGTRRKSQIQTYLEQNQGEGVQHVALMTHDIYRTMDLMTEATPWGGFEFMPGQAHDYYERVKVKLGAENPFSEEQLAKIEKLGILIDKDDQGILMQIFSKPIGDRPTIFFEIIQRVGCINDITKIQKPGCGGFGKGNFKDLFKSIEDYESNLRIN
uniref:4-hydroxyphenylpyruvate dioxygenase n=1 Tax=Spumella elongata TaxID=89044 RepID=A0A7S3HU75_9STRA|mmetsp:Transcript_9251/g.15917  ORF Transcript_9251/g.15917 Transcript_9251/m.15917 type:complete len:417 (+) Transcript_9251:63-1313(+)